MHSIGQCLDHPLSYGLSTENHVSDRNFQAGAGLLPLLTSQKVGRLTYGAGGCNQGKYFEAVAQSVDPVNRTVVACFPKDAGIDEACFKVPYDILVLGVGLPSPNSPSCAGTTQPTGPAGSSERWERPIQTNFAPKSAYHAEEACLSWMELCILCNPGLKSSAWTYTLRTRMGCTPR